MKQYDPENDSSNQQKSIQQFYQASAEKISIVELPVMKFLMVDGKGDPNTSQEFQDSVGALYSVAFTLRSILAKEMPGQGYAIMALEGLWWTKDKTEFDFDDKSNLQWTIMLVQADSVTEEMFKKAVEQTGKNNPQPALKKLRLETFDEGRAVQILHIGPYSEEKPTIEKLHKYIRDN
ncbi:MAG: GyrI-like domain-containing protein, partial [Chlorobiales bacterium]|nr:GyrI-like domain-containing protein [Chlorobiales bacterium]